LKVYKITQDSGMPLIVSNLKDIEDNLGSIEYCEVGDTFKVEVIEMSKQEFDELPEWSGF